MYMNCVEIPVEKCIEPPPNPYALNVTFFSDLGVHSIINRQKSQPPSV